MQRNRFRVVCISGLARKILLVFGSLQEDPQGVGMGWKGAYGTQKHQLLESPGGPRLGSYIPSSHSKLIF